VRAVSQQFLDALGVSHRNATVFTCTPPGGDPVTLRWSSLSVAFNASIGIRRTADATLPPVLGTDLYSIVSTPGAIFHVEHGIDYGAGRTELVDVFHGEAADGGVNIVAGEIRLRLSDLWQRVERCRFPSPYSPSAGTRSARIAAAITSAVPAATVNVLTEDGGSTVGGKTWDRDRTQFVKDLAADGSLDAYFEPDGSFTIRSLPLMDAASSVYVLRTGEYGTIINADRERPLDRLYNTVIVLPSDESQTWARQTATVTDPDHPRHPDKIGVVPFFYSSPTITTAGRAATAGRSILQRVLGTTETLKLGALSNPALEGGDIVTVVHESTETDPGFGAAHFVDSGTLDCATGEMTLQTRSAALAEIEEAA
jgi:hypothetical protein